MDFGDRGSGKAKTVRTVLGLSRRVLHAAPSKVLKAPGVEEYRPAMSILIKAAVFSLVVQHKRLPQLRAVLQAIQEDSESVKAARGSLSGKVIKVEAD